MSEPALRLDKWLWFARFFKTGFGFAKRGVLRLEVDHRALDFARQTLAFSLRLVTA